MGLQLHTRVIEPGDGAFILNGTEGVLSISYQMSGDTGDSGLLTGNLAFKAASDAVAVASEPVPIPAGGGNVFVSDANQKGLVLTIQAVQGSINLIIGV